MIPKGDEFFFNVKGLLVPKGYVDSAIDAGINKYVDVVQTLTEKLHDNLESNRMRHFVSNMEVAMSLLRAIYARWLESEASIILNAAKRGDIGICQKLLPAFITELLTLSIEIQKAQQGAKEHESYDSDIDSHESMANSLSSVGKLIDFGEYESVRNLLADMEEYTGNGAYVRLIDLIVAKEYNKAGELASLLKENHMKAIKGSKAAEDSDIKKVLAVDDRPEILDTVANALSGHYKVFGLTKAKAAINFIHAQKPDLFILDIEMPEMNGFELAEIIRATTNCFRTPIIFLTSSATREHVVKAIRVGGNDFIVKPAGYDALLAKARKYLL